MADAVQTVLTVAVPTIAVLIGIMVSNARLNDTNKRIDDLRAFMDSRLLAEGRTNEANFKVSHRRLIRLERLARWPALAGASRRLG